MKKLLFLFGLSLIISACDKEYVCNCAAEPGGLPYKKVYLLAKTDNGAERKCTKLEEGTESCTLQ
jgi:hypothetical protein